MLDAAGVDDGRAAHGRIFSPALAVRAHGGGDLADGDALGLLAGDRAGHELEQVLPGRRLGGEDAQPLRGRRRSAVALADVGHRHAARRASPSGRRSDAAVHLLVVDVDPLAAEADLGALVGGAVEALGEGAGHVGRHDVRVLASTATAPWSWMASRMSCELLRRSARTSMRA